MNITLQKDGRAVHETDTPEANLWQEIQSKQGSFDTVKLEHGRIERDSFFPTWSIVGKQGEPTDYNNYHSLADAIRQYLSLYTED